MAKKSTPKKTESVKKTNDPVKEPIKVEEVSTKKYKDNDEVEFVANGLHPNLPARKPRRMQYATAKVLVAKGFGRIRED